jgi:hypothetical protein
MQPSIFRLPLELTIILDAINFTKQKISKYYQDMASSVEENFRKPILDEMEEKIDPIKGAEAYLRSRGNSSFLLLNDESERKFFSDIISSSLKLYRYKLRKIQEETHVKGYDSLISKITYALEKDLPNANSNLFQSYAFHSNNTDSKPTKLFISYQQNDVQTACVIQKLIIQNSNLKENDVFVAHRDISLSEEWRKKMIDELENSTHLSVLCTNNYLYSAFGNQEVGYAIAKHKKIAPIFWEGTERNKFGFLEGFQSLPEFVNESNLEEIVKKILSKLEIHQTV